MGVRVTNAGTVTSTGSGTVTVQGTGGASGGNENYGIYIDGTNSQITSGGGNVSVTGQGGGTGASAYNMGVRITSAGKVTSTSSGTVTVQGTGGTGSGIYSAGVQIDGTVTSGGSGAVSVQGTAGTNSGSESYGVYVSGSTALVSSGGGNVSVIGQAGGTGTSAFNMGVRVNSGATVTAGGSGTVTVQGTGGATSGNENYGVQVAAANSRITSGGGNVSVTGQAGGSGTSSYNMGVRVNSGATVSAGGSGTVTVQGTGGATSGNENYGVQVTETNSRITSGGGSVSVTGLGGGSGASAYNMGVRVTQAGVVTSGGSGTVTVQGTGGVGTTQEHYGVDVHGANSQITSTGGNVSVTGFGGGTGSASSNRGVRVSNSGLITSGGSSGTVTVQGTGGGTTGIQNEGVFVIDTGSQITSGGGNVTVTGIGGTNSGVAIYVHNNGTVTTAANGGTLTLIGDSLEVQLTGTISAQSGSSVTLRQRTNGTLINLGGTDILTGSPLTLGLTDAELGRVTAGTVNIGNANSGAITVSAAISSPSGGKNNLSLTTGAGITVNSAVTMATNKSFSATATSATTGISLANTSADIASSGTGVISLAATRNIALATGSSLATVNGGISLIANSTGTATGNFSGIDLNGASLTTSGSGNIVLSGKGGDDAATGVHVGIFLHDGTVIESVGAATGNIGLMGGGGDGTIYNYGVLLQGSTTAITAANGDISLVGTSGASSDSFGVGVVVQLGADVRSVGTGSGASEIDIDGTGSATTHSSTGVIIEGAGVTVTSVDGDIRITGQGSLNGAANYRFGVQLANGAVVSSSGTTAEAAQITIDGTAGSTQGVSFGVHLVGANTAVTSVNGAITLEGLGSLSATGDYNHGIQLDGGAAVTSTGTGVNAASITLNGTARNGNSTNYGVLVTGTNTRIVSVDGDIELNGQGGNGGSFNNGVSVDNNGTVASTGTGSITIEGTGGTGAAEHNGIVLYGGFVSTTAGDINLTGQGGTGTGVASRGIGVYGGSQVVSTAGGTITVDATGGTGSDGQRGLEMFGAGNLIKSVDGDIDITATGGSGNTGAATYHFGTWMWGGSGIEATGGGSINIQSTGGLGSGFDHGLVVDNNNFAPSTTASHITTENGNLVIAGTSGASTGNSNQGVLVFAGGRIATTGTGELSLTGVSFGTGANSNVGVVVDNLNAPTGFVSQVTTTSGTLSIVGNASAASTGAFNEGVVILNGGLVDSTNGAITIDGTGGTGLNDNRGVLILTTGSKVSSQNGSINITGQGGSGNSSGYGGHHGVQVALGGQIESSGSAPITLDGTGGTGGGSYNFGVIVNDTGAAIVSTASGTGAILVTGQGGTSSGDVSIGVSVTSGGQITSAGSASITLLGAGGDGPSYSHGVEVWGPGSKVESVAGAITLNGVAAGSGAGDLSFGVNVTNFAQVVSTGAATITMTGTAGVGSTSTAIAVTGDGKVLSSGTGAVTSVGDSVLIDTTGSINTGGNTVSIRQKTDGTLINLGGADVLIGSPRTIGLTDAELDRITAGTISIGNSNSGTITISNAIDRAAATNLSLASQGSIIFSGSSALLDANGGDVSLNVRFGVESGGITSGGGSRDIRANEVTLNGGSSGIGSLINPLVTEGTSLIAATSGLGPISLSEIDTINIPFVAAFLGSVNLISGTFRFMPTGGIDGHSPLYLGSDAVLQLNGTEKYVNSLSGSGRVTNDSTTAGTLRVFNQNSSTFSGVLGGPGANDNNFSLTTEDIGSGPGGTFTLSGANTYTGTTTVNFRTLKLGNGSALGSIAGGTTVASGAVLDLNGQSIGEEAVTLNGTGISSGGALINSSGSAASLSGNITLTNASSIGGSGNATYSGTVNGGFGLTLVGAGTKLFSGLVGDSAPLTSITQNDATGAVQFNQNVAVGSSGATFNANVTLDGLTFTSGGAVTFGNASSDTLTISGAAVTVSTTAGSIVLNSTTAANQDFTLTAGGTTSDLTISAGTTGITAASGINVALNADRTVTISENVTASGTGSISVSGHTGAAVDAQGAQNILVNSGAVVSTANGNLLLDADTGSQFIGNFVGVDVNVALIRVTGTGALTVNGTGGDDGIGRQYGVQVSSTGTDHSHIIGGTSGLLTVEGTGGASAGQRNYGVFTSGGNSSITSLGSNVSIIGNAGGSGSTTVFNTGVRLELTSLISAGGSGAVSVVGLGTDNGTSAVGVAVLSASRITSSGGNVSVEGTGRGSSTGGSSQGVNLSTGGSSGGKITAGGTGTVTVVGIGGSGSGGANHGVFLTGSNSEITSGGGSVTITGTAGGGTSSAINVVTTGSITTATSGGPVTLIGDSMNFDASATVSAQNSSSVTLRQKATDGSVAINLGGADASGSLGLTDAKLDRVTAGTVNIGNSNSGTITVSADISRATNTNVNLTTGSGNNIAFGAFSLNAGTGGDVSLTTIGSGAITTGDNTGTDLTADDVTLNAGSGGIGSTTNFMRLAARTVTATTSGTGGINLVEADSVAIAAGGLNVGTGTITLGSGTFYSANDLSYASPVSINSGATLAVNGRPLNGLVSLWHAEGNANDSIGGNTGALISGATANTAGQVGTAFQFDGVDDYVDFGDVLDQGLNSFSIEAWIKLTTAPSTGATIVAKGSTSTSLPPDIGYQLRTVQDKLNFNLMDGPGSALQVTSSTTLSLNQYYHVAAVMDRDLNVIQIYIDGTLAGQLSFTTFGSVSNDLGFTIGALNRAPFASAVQFFHGQIDEPAIYNRALSASEIQGIIAGSHNYTQTAGTLSVNGTLTANAISLQGTSTVQGTGTISGPTTVASGATVAPGNSTGILNTGNVAFSSGSMLSTEINAFTTAGTDYDQLNVTGTVSLGNATLSLSGSLAAIPTLPIVIINNDGSDAVTGTFNGLAEGATMLLNGYTLAVSYVGGDGNDVVLLGSVTEISLDGSNNLLISDYTATKNDNLTIKSNTTSNVFVVNDPNGVLLTTIAGAIGNGTATVTIPFSAVAGANIFVNTLAGNDSLTVDHTLGLFSKTVVYNGGDPTTGSGDSLSIVVGAAQFNTVTFNYTNTHAGTVSLDTDGPGGAAASTISYTGLEPITTSGTSTNLVFNLTAQTDNAVMEDTGTSSDGQMRIRSTDTTPTFETTVFASPSTSLTINGGAGDDNITVASVDSTFNASLTINGDAESDTVNLNSDITFASGKSLSVTAETLSVGANTDLSTSGAGSITLASDSIAIPATSTLVSAGTVTLSPQTSGQVINLGAADSAGTLGLTDAELDRVTATTLRIGSATAGALTVVGDMDSTSITNLHLITGSSITSTAGGIANNRNVALEAGGTINITDSNTTFNTLAISAAGQDVTVIEADGFSLADVDGVQGFTGRNISLTATTGNITVSNGGAANDIAASGTLSLETTADNALLTIASGAVINGTAGDHTYTADKIDLQGTLTATGRSVTLKSKTAGDAINLGSTVDNTSATVLELSDAELDRITASSLTVGSTNADTITISAILTQPGKHVTLQTGAGVSGSASLTIGAASATTLTIDQAGNSTFSGTLGGAGTNENNFTFTKTGSGTLTLSGTNSFTGATTINSGRLNVNGSTAASSAFTVNSTGILGGTGTVNGSVSVASGGAFAPGTSPGTLSTGNLTLASGATFQVEVQSTASFDKAIVSGMVNLGSATLNVVSFGSPVVNAGDKFMIINNNGTSDAVTGTFSGLADGAVVSMNFLGSGKTARITYFGGDGNDVAIVVDQATSTATVPNDGNANAISTVVIGNTLQVLADGIVINATPVDGITNLTITGVVGQNDTLTANVTANPDLAKLGTLVFNGGGDTADRVSATGSDILLTYDDADSDSGTLDIDGTLLIDFDGIGNNTITLTGTNNLTIDFGDGAANIVFTRIDATTTQVAGTGFTTTTFTNPATSLTVNLGTNGDSITFTDLERIMRTSSALWQR